jgi:hypothetical protein
LSLKYGDVIPHLITVFQRSDPAGFAFGLAAMATRFYSQLRQAKRIPPKGSCNANFDTGHD